MSNQIDGQALALPAWLGPDKLFILDKAGAFRFGIFQLDRVSFAFADPNSVIVSGLWEDVRVDWPRIYAGAALRIRSASGKVVVAFARPFPEAPGPDPGTAEEAAELLSSVAGLSVGDAL